MKNAELIEAIRENEECNNCEFWKHGECNERKMSLAAADALEMAEKRIAELKLDNKILKNTIDADKGVMLDRIRYLEAQMPKEAHWVAVQNGIGVCSNCNRQDSIDNMATHCRYCGARMRGEHDEQIH